MAIIKHWFFNRRRIPIPIVILIIMAVILPFYLILIMPKSGIVATPYKVIQYKAMVGPFIHTILEWTGICFAVFTAVFSVIHYRFTRDLSTPIIGLALFFTGCLDFFYILGADNILLKPVDTASYIPFTWSILRIFFVVVLIAGVFTVYMRDKKILKEEVHKTKDNLNEIYPVLLACFIFAILAFIIVNVCVKNYLPINYFPKNFISRPIDMIALVLFLIAGLFIFPYHYRKYPSLFSHGLVYSTLPALAAQISMAIGSKYLFDPYFHIASFLKLISYGVLFVGIALDYIHTYRSEVRNKERLYSSFKQLEDRKKELEEVNMELDAFIYSASHDLRTPLRGIASFSSILKEEYGPKLDEAASSYLARIQAGIDKMDELINKLLALSKAGRVDNERENVDMNMLINDAVNKCKKVCDVGVEFIVKDTFPKIICDKIKIADVIYYLLNNASKFISKTSKAIVEIGYKDNKKAHCIYIKDNGIGIEKQFHGSIFDMFVRLNPPSEYEGAGMGLNIAKKIIKHHGGQIWVESELGKGSCFFFVIPK